MEIFFALIVSLLLLHEMDAIRAREWKMFIVLKDMNKDRACKVFLLAHLPLFFVVFLIMLSEWTTAQFVLYCIVDVFLVGHAILHFCFRKHPDNGFTSLFSKTLILLPAILGIVHLCLLFIW